MNPYITINTLDGEFSAYVARPQAAMAPAIVVIQEIFGVNDGIKSIADEMARQGFVAICPDLFWRTDPGLSMSESNEADIAKGFALYGAYDFDQGVADIARTIATARSLPYCSGQAGVMGYCLGGLLTFLTAAANEADAAVAYYGGGTDRFLDRAQAIETPMLMHLAGEDEYIGKAAQQAIYAALDGVAGVELHTYPGRDHAFARPGGAHYDEAAATLANGRTVQFLRQHLG